YTSNHGSLTGIRSRVLYSARGRGLHHSGTPLVCAPSDAGSKQNSNSRASLVQKLTIPPVVTRWIVLGAFKYGIAPDACGQILLSSCFFSVFRTLTQSAVFSMTRTCLK